MKTKNKIETVKDMLFLIDALRNTDKYIVDIFLSGGCYQFHLMLKKLNPNCEPRINKEENHIVTFFKGKNFDINGIAKGKFYPLKEHQENMVSKWSFSKHRLIQIGECPICEEPIIV